MNTVFQRGKGNPIHDITNTSTHRVWLRRLLPALVILAWLATPAFGQDGNRFYSATVDPTSVAAGEMETLTFTITNCDGLLCAPSSQKAQQIRTATVDIPGGFTVDPLSCAIVAAEGDVWDLTFLAGQMYIDKEGSTGLAIGESLMLSCTVTASCDAGFYQWTTAAFNDDVEPPGPGITPYTLVGGQPTVEITGECEDGGFEYGDYCSYTQGAWGAPPHGGNPAKTLADNFESVYPVGLVVGTGYDMTFLTAADVQFYLPDGGPAAPLESSVVNPEDTSSGVFGSQVTALHINVDLNDAGLIDGFDGTFSALILTGTGTSLDGSSVAEILAVAEMALGGGDLPFDYSYANLNDLVTNLNEAFDECYPTEWAQAHLTRP